MGNDLIRKDGAGREESGDGQSTTEENDGSDEIRRFLGKWIPQEFEEHFTTYKGPYHEQTYDFEFGRVEVKSGNNSIWGITHMVRFENFAQYREYNLESLFDPKIKEMYLDCKEAFRKALEKWSSTLFPALKGLNLDRYCVFQRRSSLHVQIENWKGAYEDQDKLDALDETAETMYKTMKKSLFEKFGFVKPEKEMIYDRSEILPVHLNQLYLHPHTYVAISRLIHQDTGCHPGTLYIRIISDEEGDPAFHDAVFKHCGRHLNERYSNVLEKDGDNNAFIPFIPCDGVRWEIDLSNVEMFKRMMGQRPNPRLLRD